MAVLLGAYQAGLLVLVVSGAIKLWRPAEAALALRTAGLAPRRLRPRMRLRFSQMAARLLGGLELAAGATGLAGTMAFAVDGSWSAVPAMASGGLYLGFLWFVHRLGKADASAGCGCFGAASEPPGWFHQVSVTISAVVSVAVAVVIMFIPDPSVIVNRGGATVVLVALHVVVVAVLAYLLAFGPVRLAAVHGAIRAARSPGHAHSNPPMFSLDARILAPPSPPSP